MRFKNLLKEKWFSYTFAICCGVLLFVALTHINYFFYALGVLGGFFWPVFLALIISYVMSPLVGLFENKVFGGIKKPVIRRNLSLFFAFFSILIFFVVIILALIPQLVDSVSTFVSNISGYVTNFDQYLDSISGFATSYNININNYLDDISKFLQQFAATLPEKAVALGSQSVSAGRSLFNLFIAIILSVYFLADSEKLLRGFKRFMHGLLSEDVYERAGIFLHRCDKIMVNYIVCDLLDGLIVGVVTWIFMILLRMPYSVIIAVVVGITNLAPTFGPIVGGAIGCFILVLVNPISALIFLIYVLVIQTLDGYVIKPKLFGDSLGVSGLWILVGIIIGGRMMGVVGILLAIPVVAIIDFVYHDYLIVWLEERKKVAKESVEEKTKNE